MASHGAQPFAIQLARERFRQQAMGGLLARMGMEDDAVSRESGGDLCLVFTRSAYDRLKEQGATGLTTDELLAGVRANLGKACDLVIERDRQDEGPVLKINTEKWFLIAKPGEPAWVVVSIRPQTMNIRGTLAGLPWRLLSPDEDSAAATPLPLWLLAQAKLYDRELRLDAPGLRSPDRPADERAEAARLREMRELLPDAVQDLCAAFRLLQWERKQRARRSWKLKLALLDEDEPGNRRRSYLIEEGISETWPDRGLRVALQPDSETPWAWIKSDPASPSRWLLHGRSEVSPEVTVFELPQDEYRRQAGIAERLMNPWLLQSDDTALAATQIHVPTNGTEAPDFDLLPGEDAWEPRQQQALRLALADHPICAVKGPPGTGKSTVIVGLVRRAIHAGKRVLLVAPTHVALDEVLGRVHELREKDQERAIVAARVAPADERRAQIKPELEEYIARHLGRNLARTSIRNIREQISALPQPDVLTSAARTLAETASRLRELAATRSWATRAKERLEQTEFLLVDAAGTKNQRQSELHAARAALDAARQRESVLGEASRHFSEIETRYFDTRNAAAVNEQRRNELESGLERARIFQQEKQGNQQQAEASLIEARKVEEKRRPTGKWDRFVEKVLSPHARAVQAIQQREGELEAANHALNSALQNVRDLEWDLGVAKDASEQAQHMVAEVIRDLRERLSPAEALIKESHGNTDSDWVVAMPESLRRAVMRASETLRQAVEAVTRAEQELATAAEGERLATASRDEARAERDRADQSLSAMEAELRALALEIEDVSPARIAELEDRSAAAARELDRTTRHRGLLQRWLEFYEHEEGDEQVTTWALSSVNLVAATTQGIAGSREFAEQHFDLVICDESSRVTRGEILVPADRAGRIVLVGDEKQLPPYVETEDEQFLHALTIIHLAEGRVEALPDVARRLCDEWNVDEPEFRPVRVEEVCERARTILTVGALPAWPPIAAEVDSIEARLRAWRRVADALTGSCFDHLLNLPETRFVRLSVQRRMVPEIATLVSEPVYGGDYQSPENSPVTPLLTDQFPHAWTIFDTASYCAQREKFREEHRGTGFRNKGEATAVVLALKDHVATAQRTGKRIDGLMVITFYLAQARYIEALVNQDKELRGRRIAILPIDRCQGQEADVVVVSFVRTLLKPRPNAGRWLQDARRLNVAFTRARRSLVLIGNLTTLTRLRGDPAGEKILAHLGDCVAAHPEHRIEQLPGL